MTKEIFLKLYNRIPAYQQDVIFEMMKLMSIEHPYISKKASQTYDIGALIKHYQKEKCYKDQEICNLATELRRNYEPNCDDLTLDTFRSIKKLNISRLWCHRHTFEIHQFT